MDRANVSGEYSALRIDTTQSHTPYRKRLLKLGNKLLQVQAQRLFAMLHIYQTCLYPNLPFTDTNYANLNLIRTLNKNHMTHLKRTKPTERNQNQTTTIVRIMFRPLRTEIPSTQPKRIINHHPQEYRNATQNTPIIQYKEITLLT